MNVNIAYLIIKVVSVALLLAMAPLAVPVQGKTASWRMALGKVAPDAPSEAVCQNHESDQQKLFRNIYTEAYKHFRERRGLVLADSLYRMAMEAGDTDVALQALMVKVKHESEKDDNFVNVEQCTAQLMNLAKKCNSMKYFYTGVSFKVTYYINQGKYAKAIEFQSEMLDYAKQRGDSYGIVIGYVSMGNLYRRRLHMVKAIDQYSHALEAYRKYDLDHDLGIDYKRIAECYVIVGNFNKVLETVAEGLKSTDSGASISGLYGYKAFAMFMLERDKEFYNAYSKYYSYKSVKPDSNVFVANCLETRKMIYDGRDTEAEAALAEHGLGKMGAFRTYVEMAYYKRKGMYGKLLEGMRQLNISLYGDSKGSFAADWARTCAKVNNNLADIDRQHAAYVNSQLQLINTDLELRSTDLELSHARDAERLALMAVEAKRLSLNNQTLLSRQLRDSLATQQLRRVAQEQEMKSGRTTFLTILGTVIVLMLLAYNYLVRNTRMTRQLKNTNNDLRQTLDDLSVANERAQESDRKKTEFMQNMSHEIRTPLNAIVGFSQVLTDQDDVLNDEERKSMNDIINTNSGVLNTLVNDILDITSIESGRYAVRKDTVKVNNICHQSLDETRSRKPEGVHLRLETELSDDVTVCTDNVRVRQVIVNMLTNAMKNTAEGSIVLGCSLSERPGMLTFTVTDTGVGIPEDKREAIFERFCKLDQFKQGVGLGLSLCRAIAVKLGGEIDIDRSYKGGARFWFAIPYH